MCGRRGINKALSDMRIQCVRRRRSPLPPQGSDLLETVLATLIQAASRVLKVDARDLDGDVKLHEYGFDQVKLAELFRHMSEDYSLALTARPAA